MTWLSPAELRVGLGCMRLDDDATVAAARDAGITVFDTARAYPGGEKRLARMLQGTDARIVTKGGMRRDGGAWIPDGRAATIRRDCEASLDALAGLPIDLYLLHAPDPRTSWRTSVRALARLVDEGLVRRIGVANVNRDRLDEAVALAPISAVQVALSPYDDAAVRGGVLARCEEHGLVLLAHSPLGGPRRYARLLRDGALVSIPGATPGEAVLAWLRSLSPAVVPIPGARRPETARSAARAAALELPADTLAELGRAFGVRPVARARRTGAEVVLVMGVPGAGKTRLAEEYATRGYERLNRDARGGTLREIAAELEERMAGGAQRVVLDNTYLTRAARSRVVDAARAHGASVRCVWLETPVAQAQINLVERLLDRFGELPAPDELRAAARREPGLLAPTSQLRAFRELEEPAGDEGFAAIERVEFVRTTRPGGPGVFVAAAAVRDGWRRVDGEVPHLLFDWLPDGAPEALTAEAGALGGNVEIAVCSHGGGPPVCWCRPPLPGLLLVFARHSGVAPELSMLVGTSTAHRTLAANVGARYVDASSRS